MSQTRPLRVLMTGDLFAFPTGTGATSRVLAIGRGLRAAGAQVHVLVTRYVDRDRETALNPASHGVFQGLPFTYTPGTSLRPTTFTSRRCARTRGIVASTAPFAWSEPPDAVLLFTGHTFALPVLNRVAASLRDAVLIFDACEMPFVYEQESARKRVEERLYTPCFYRLYDGFMVISDLLERYFSERARANARMIRVPILVDVDRFATPADAPRPSRPYIAYSGVIGDSKGVIDLVRAFGHVAPRFPHLDLVLSGGPTNGPYIEELMRVASQLAVGDRVRLAGTRPYDEFPALLQHAEALVVPHVSGIWAQAAFPTKLGEYLASGTPTVATRVGDLDRFVTDGVDVFLSPPDDPVALGRRIAQVLDDPQTAHRIGARGQETARRAFDYRVHGARLADFIRGLQVDRAQRRRGRTVAWRDTSQTTVGAEGADHGS